MSWNKTRFSQWEVEGEVRKRVEAALAQAERDRLVNQSRIGGAGRAVRRIVSSMGMGLDWVMGRLRAGWEASRVWLGSPLGLEEGGDEAQELT